MHEPRTTEPSDARYAIGELADAAGVSRRAVRFYVQRGLIAPPIGVGRGAHYDAGHLAQLFEVKRRQEAGEPLDAIARALGADTVPPPAAFPPLEAWARLSLAPGVELSVREGALTPAQIAALVLAVRARLSESGVSPDADPDPDPDPSPDPHAQGERPS
jgi:DNA-binding transcriptional MerR regulator